MTSSTRSGRIGARRAGRLSVLCQGPPYPGINLMSVVHRIFLVAIIVVEVVSSEIRSDLA